MAGFAELYAPRALQAWGLPLPSADDPAGGVFRAPLLNWSALPRKSPDGDDAPLWLLCCDVLSLDQDVVLDRTTLVFARRIEVKGTAGLILKRIDGSGHDLVLFAQEVVDAVTGDARLLNITAAIDDSTLPVYDFRPDVGGGATGVMWPERAAAAKRMSPQDLEPAYLFMGSPLRLNLTTMFQIATLLSTQRPDLSIAQLQWIGTLGQASAETWELSAQAVAMAGQLIAAKEAGQHALLVPQLDSEIYASAANAMMVVLRDRCEKWEALKDRQYNDENWISAAKAALLEQRNQKELGDKLLQQAEDSRRQAMSALGTAIGQVNYERVQIGGREIDFRAGIDKWKQNEQLKAVIDVVMGVVQILAQIPAVVAAGPELLALPILKEGVPLLLDSAKFIVEWNAKLFTGGRYGRRGAIQDIGNVDGDDDDQDFVIVDEFEHNPKVYSAADAAKAAEKRKADLAAIQQNLINGLKAAGAGAQAVYDSATQIIAIGDKALRMQQTSRQIYASINASLGNTFASADLQGLDTVTGGQQRWDELKTNIEDVFDRFEGGLLRKIEGGGEYRLEFRRLIDCGKSLSEARLAVAKANMQVAEMKLRQSAAEKSVQIAEQRQRQLAERQAYTVTMAQLVYNTVIDTKRSIYLAIEAYRRAFVYFTLADEARAPVLPQITDRKSVV